MTVLVRTGSRRRYRCGRLRVRRNVFGPIERRGRCRGHRSPLPLAWNRTISMAPGNSRRCSRSRRRRPRRSRAVEPRGSPGVALRGLGRFRVGIAGGRTLDGGGVGNRVGVVRGRPVWSHCSTRGCCRSHRAACRAGLRIQPEPRCRPAQIEAVAAPLGGDFGPESLGGALDLFGFDCRPASSCSICYA